MVAKLTRDQINEALEIANDGAAASLEYCSSDNRAASFFAQSVYHIFRIIILILEDKLRAIKRGNTQS